jgi:phage recombination protein Bet
MGQAAQSLEPAGSKKSLVKTIAHKYGVEESQMLNTLKKTCFSQGENKPEVSNEQMMALLVVADQYDLNPFTREIYAFPQNGGIVPIVGIDGWMNIINSHPDFNGMNFEDNFDNNGNLVSCTCTMYRKDRDHPTVLTEYLMECKKNTGPWNDKPVRMLRHKVAIQAARYTFSFSGIYDEDEGRDIRDVDGSTSFVDHKEGNKGSNLPFYSEDEFILALDKWKALVIGGKKTVEDILNMVRSKYSLTEDQEKKIKALGELS